MRQILLISLVSIFLSANAQSAKKSFIYCSEGSPSAFNPQIATDGTTFNASSRTVYNRLVDFEKGGTKIIPSLAKSWKVSKNGLKFSFELRKGVKFHTTKYFTPTRDFNADDVIFSFNRQLDKNHSFHKVSGGKYTYFKSMDMHNIIKKIVKKGDYKVEFHLNKAEAPFLANLAMDFASILSAEYANKMKAAGTPEKIDNLPIGTGPFVYKKYVKDTLIRYTNNKNYFQGASPLNNLIFSITPDPSVRFQKLKKKECHLVAEPSPVDLKAMRSDNNIRVIEKAGLNVGYVAMNVEKKPFDNVLVRQAVHMALNRGAYIKAIYLNNAAVAKNPIPPTMWSYNKKVKDYNYNPEKAKQLLAKAGFPNGFTTELWTLPVSRPYNPNGKKMGELIQSDLKKIGIRVKLVTYDWPTYLAKANEGQHTMIQLGWTGDNGDPDNFLNVLLGCPAIKSGSNVARWCHQPFYKLIEKAKTTSNQKLRTKYYLQAQEIFKRQAPWVTIAHAKVFRAMRADVKGFEINPFGADIFYGVDLQ